MKSKLFLIFIVLILLSVSGVSASDINQTNINEIDNYILSTSNNDIGDTISASENDLGILNVSNDSNYINQSTDTGTFTDLYNLILNTNDETLELTRDYKYDNNTDYALIDGMSIHKEITINGQNYLIDGISQATIFQVHSNVILKNINFINGKCSIVKDDEVKSSIFNCNFINNSYSAISNYGGYVDIFNCSFANNSAELGGAIYGASNVFNCSFVNNSAIHGGAIYGASNVFNCSFVDNSVIGSDGRGGAILCDGVVDSCSFVNNSADLGGAIYNSYGEHLNVTNCSFVSNSAGEYGGAIYSGDNVFNCSFVSNSADYGGAIYNSYGEHLNVTNCSFVSNSASYVGGAIEGNGVVDNCSFVNNSAGSFGDDIHGCGVKNCMNVKIYGGGIVNNCTFINTSSVSAYEFNNCIFINNSASSDGGAIFSASNVFNCIFINNSASSDGGAIYGASNVFNCSFVSNSAGDCGGAIYRGQSNCTVFNCSFVSNSASGGGAVCYANVFNCSFVSNSADYGGAISSSDVHDCSFVNNSAIHGGAISSSDVHDCSFVNNSAGEYGGAIYSGDNVFNCSFVSNSADLGGAIYIGDNVFNCSFVNNSAIHGGAVCNGNVFNCSFVNNSNGVITEFDMMYSFITNCSFVNNSNGFVIRVYNSCDVNNCTFINNSVTIWGDDYSSIDVKNCTFINNTDDKDGVNIYYDNNHLFFRNSKQIIEGNSTIQILDKTYTSHRVYMEVPFDVLLTKGDYNYILTFTTDDNNKYIIYDNITVNDSTICLTAHNVIKYYNGSEKFVVTLKNKDNKSLICETVSITINGVFYERTTDSNGQVSLALNLNCGEYDIATHYNNHVVYSKVTVISTIQSNDITKIFRNDTQYYATFLDNKGNFLKNKNVTFNINGVFYTRTTNDKGVAKLNINLQQGDYIITATNPVTHEQRSNIVKVLPSIIENNNITKYYKNDTQYVVKVLNLDGSVAGAGVNVTFNINGVFYTRTTNASGHAKLNINLAPDEYTITAEYNTLRVSNKIKVLPVLSAEDLSMSYKDGSKFEAKLLDGHGKAYASQTIKFNINGVFYDRTTDANGIAKLNINLMSGKYIITSMYNGAAISNEVTIR